MIKAGPNGQYLMSLHLSYVLWLYVKPCTGCSECIGTMNKISSRLKPPILKLLFTMKTPNVGLKWPFSARKLQQSLSKWTILNGPKPLPSPLGLWNQI